MRGNKVHHVISRGCMNLALMCEIFCSASHHLFFFFFSFFSILFSRQMLPWAVFPTHHFSLCREKRRKKVEGGGGGVGGKIIPFSILLLLLRVCAPRTGYYSSVAWQNPNAPGGEEDVEIPHQKNSVNLRKIGQNSTCLNACAVSRVWNHTHP